MANLWDAITKGVGDTIDELRGVYIDPHATWTGIFTDVNKAVEKTAANTGKTLGKPVGSFFTGFMSGLWFPILIVIALALVTLYFWRAFKK